MRALRTACRIAGVLLLAPAFAQASAAPTVQQMLKIKPVVEGAVVEYDVPTDQAAATCVVEPSQSPPGWVLRDGQGKVLRKFVVANGGTINQWSYYQDGFEVYRELSLDNNTSVEEARWMNGGGTRVASVADNKIVGWKRISAEEASKTLVQALVSDSPALIETIMIKPDELASLGVPAAEVQRAEASAKGRAAAVAALRKGLAGWDKSTVWLRFDAAMPHVIPGDAAAGLKGDLTLYENAVILAGPAGGAPGDKTAFLQAGEVVKVGETWKFVDLPGVINAAGGAPVVAMQGGIRSAVYRDSGGAGGAGDPEQQKAIQMLAEFDNKNAQTLAGNDKKAVAQYYIDRVRYLRAVEKATKKPDEALAYVKQEIDCIANAYQTGQYPEGLKRLTAIEGQKDKFSSYAAFRRLNADFNLDNENQANPVAAQNRWMKDMKAFLDAFPKSDEEPEVLFQLASNSEFNGEEKDARDYYGRLVAEYPDAPSGKKAAGAIRRLDSVGKPIALKGKTVDGQTLDTTMLRGKTVLIAFWATSVPAARKDLPEIAKIYEKTRAKGFEVVSVCLDNDQAALADFLKANPLPWPTVFEAGGLEGRLASEFGIIVLPTMILVDKDAKVISRAVRNAADLDIQLDKALSGNKADGGVAVRPAN